MTKRKKRKKKKSAWVYYVFAAVIIVLIAWAYAWWSIPKAKFVKYEAFGIPIPENFEIHGIDVSRYQQTISWEAVKEMQVKKVGLGFAFIKATEGIGNTDPNFKRNWRKSKQAGIIRGAYHFFVSSKDGREQAENFIKQVKLEKNDLPPVVDIEQTNGTGNSVIKKELKEWLDIVENHYGVKPIIYTNVDFYKKKLGSAFDTYPLWIAHYFEYNAPRINRPWSFWQHSEEGRVNGILSKVDFNVYNGDSTSFKSLLIQ